MHRDLAPILGQAVGRWLPIVSGGAYSEISVDPADLNVTVKEQATGQWRTARLLSEGTREQIFLLLRVAMAEHLVTTNERAPLILDEVTAQSDAERKVQLLEVLHRLSAERQVVLFTHDDDVVAWAEQALHAPQDRLVRLEAPRRMAPVPMRADAASPTRSRSASLTDPRRRTRIGRLRYDGAHSASMPNDRLPTPDRVLVVAAHPDDIEFGAAGTVARWVGEGAEVRYLVMTRGDKGSDDPSADPAAIGRAREAEQRAAAAEIGVSGVDFLDEPDGQVEPSLRLRERVTFAIRSFRPEVVMTHDPTVVFVNNEWVNHPDHRAVGQVTVDAVYPDRPRSAQLPGAHRERAWPPGRSPSSTCGAPTKRTRSWTSATPSSARSRRWRTIAASSTTSPRPRAGSAAGRRSSASGRAIGPPRASAA